MTQAFSLRARLLALLLAATLVAALVQAATAYRAALREADLLFDYQMQQMALGLRSELPVAPSAPSRDGSLQQHQFVIQIWSVDGLRIYQTHADAVLPRQAILGFSEAQVGGNRWRIYSVRTARQLVQVAQDLTARAEMARTLAWRSLRPILVVAPLLMLAIWWVVTRAMRSVDEATRSVSQRAAHDVEPLPTAGLPSEVVPLVLALNALFVRVRDAFDAQRGFVAEAAHELRSPLTALRLQLQSLERAPDDTARAVAIERLRQGIDRATRLVEQLLALAREESPDPKLRSMQPIDAVALARALVGEMAPFAAARGIDLGLDAPDTLTLDGDADALRVLLRNLIDNAIKHTPQDGRVDVSLAARAQAVALSVDDSGPGIAAAERDRVFDRFHRGSGARGIGSGLGLAIVRAIADRHHGRVTLGDSPLGGLRVAVELPQHVPARA